MTWLASRLDADGADAGLRRVALATFLGALAQAPLGAITVYFDLNPWLVLSHFLLSLVAPHARRARGARGVERRAATPLPLRLRQLALLVGVAVRRPRRDGDVRDGRGPLPGQLRRQADPAARRLLCLRCGCTSGRPPSSASRSLVLARAGSRAAASRAPPLARSRSSRVLAAQMAVGEIQYRIDMLWWIVLIHVTLAALLWAATVVFVAVLWRPRDRSRMAR